MAHFFDDALLEDFQRLSGWQLLSADDFLMLISDREDREDLLNERREDRAGEHESHSHRRGEHVYRYNLYGDGYWRHRRGAEFVSLYARVHPEEDFAESFRTYFRSPSRLRRQCPQKYEFMRARLPGLIAEAQAELALGEFDAESDRLLETVPEAGGFRARTEGHIAALRQRLGLDLAAGAEGAPPARTESGETPGPTDVEDTRVRDIGRALRPSVQALVDLGASLGRRYEEFAAGIEAREATVEPALRAQFPWLGREVLRDLARELLEMQDAAAEAIVSREEAGGASVEEQLEAPIARSARALDVIESYLPIYYAATSVPMDLVHLLEDDPSLSARQQDEVRARFRLLRDEMTTLVSEIQARIAAGTPASAPPELPDPSARLREHEEAIFTLETGGAEPVAGSR